MKVYESHLEQEYEAPFTITLNSIIQNPALSFKAKGLWTYLKSKPQGWRFSAERIAQDSPEGITSITSALKELEHFGYLARKKIYFQGKVSGVKYSLFKSPKLDKLTSENLTSENLTSENLILEKLRNKKERVKNKELNNNNITKSEISKNEIIDPVLNNDSIDLTKQPAPAEGKEKSSAKKESLVFDCPEDFSEEVVHEFFIFIEQRQKSRNKIGTQHAVNLLIKTLTPYDNPTRLLMIQRSIISNWAGIFPEKKNAFQPKADLRKEVFTAGQINVF